MSRALEGRIALVAGASRGAGRGIALALAEAGAFVYLTGRTTRAGGPPVDGAPGSIEQTADEIAGRGGRAEALRADHTNDEDVRSVIECIEREQGRLDVLANAVWGGNEIYAALDWRKPFWEQEVDCWRPMFEAGVRAYLMTSARAFPLLVNSGRGLVVHVTDGGAEEYHGHLYWDLAHAGINRMASTMAIEGRGQNVAVVALNPGFMKTERVLMHLRTEEDRQQAGFDRSESPEYLGRAVVALAADPAVAEKSGRVLHVGDLAAEYGFVDVDGVQRPRFELQPDWVASINLDTENGRKT